MISSNLQVLTSESSLQQHTFGNQTQGKRLWHTHRIQH
jgi:hypothetical protein